MVEYIARMVEQWAFNLMVQGSNPCVLIGGYNSILVEYMFCIHKVAGSSPATSILFMLKKFNKSLFYIPPEIKFYFDFKLVTCFFFGLNG